MIVISCSTYFSFHVCSTVLVLIVHIDQFINKALLIKILMLKGGVVRVHSVKTANTDYCYFHMEILYVDIYKFGTYSINIL